MVSLKNIKIEPIHLVSDVLDVFLKDIKAEVPQDITDRVFLIIEKSYILNQVYNALAVERGKNSVNKTIGKLIKAHWDLTNTGISKKPKSKLIQSYTKHGMKVHHKDY